MRVRSLWGNTWEGHRGRWSSIALAFLIAVTSACTTVTRTNLSTGNGSGTNRSTRSGATADQQAASTVDDGTIGGGGSLTGGDAGGGGTDGSGGGSDAAAAAGSTCSQTVKIGVSYSSDIATGLAAVGNPSAATQFGDYVQQQQALYQRMADDINARGGLAGCKVALVYHDFKALGSDGFSGESQTECSDFAEDQHVFAVISTTLENRTLVDCLAQHNVVNLFYGFTYNPTAADLAKYRGYFYQPSYVAAHRYGPFIDQLAGAGYFPSGAKVGILLADDGSGVNTDLVNNVWKPRLAALGINPVVFTFHQIESYSDVAGVTSQLSAAVLQFKAAGVDHVMSTPDNGDAVIFFTQVADSQGFHPRYALTTAAVPSAWGTEPASQRPNALTVSYSIGDLGAVDDDREVASNPPNDARAHCDALYQGQTGNAPLATAYRVCDAFNFLAAALSGASAVTADALLAGAENLGSSLALSDGYSNATFSPPGHYDGGSATRVMQWDEGSQVWRYVSGVLPLP